VKVPHFTGLSGSTIWGTGKQDGAWKGSVPEVR
jgi:hypothetical protein